MTQQEFTIEAEERIRAATEEFKSKPITVTMLKEMHSTIKNELEDLFDSNFKYQQQITFDTDAWELDHKNGSITWKALVYLPFEFNIVLPK